MMGEPGPATLRLDLPWALPLPGQRWPSPSLVDDAKESQAISLATWSLQVTGPETPAGWAGWGLGAGEILAKIPLGPHLSRSVMGTA